MSDASVPADVLLGLCWVGVFSTLEPKAKPFHVALLGDHPIPWLLQYVRSFRDIDHLHRFTKLRQTGVPVPFEQQRVREQSLNADRSFDFVHKKRRRLLQLTRHSVSIRRAAEGLLVAGRKIREHHILEVTAVGSVGKVRRCDVVFGRRRERQEVIDKDTKAQLLDHNRESTSAVLELLVAPRFDDLGIVCVLILQEILTK